MTDATCFSCAQDAVHDPPPRDQVLVTEHWRVAHAFDSSLLGWLVVAPRRHVLALSELSSAEATELGPLLVDLSRGLERAAGCTKTYLMQFSEAEGFSHLHMHVVPRMPDQPETERGPRVLSRLGHDSPVRVSAPEMDRVATAVRAAVNR